jgi:peptidase A4-like protein/putative Ig domain-containing protein
VRILRMIVVLLVVWTYAGGTKAQTKATACGAATSSCATKSEVATFTVTVNPRERAAEREAAVGRPKIERVNDKFLMMTLEKEHSGTTVDAPTGTLIELRLPAEMGATEFELSPPGILTPQSGVRHLPKGVIGLLSAENEGTATIHVFGLPGNPKFTNATPNWAGYQVTGGPFSSIVGEWTVPTVVSDGDSATWVGIDGNGGTLIQTGTAQIDSGGFLGFGEGTTYYAWYQLFPSEAVTIPKPVSPGDHIIAFVLAGGEKPPVPNQATTFWIYVNNETKNWYYTKSLTYTGPLNAAEWIEERPEACLIFNWFCGLSTLANFGSVTFDGEDYTNGVNPDLLPGEALSMMDGNTTVAIPSNPDADRDGFTIAYGADQPLPPGPYVQTATLPDAYVGIPYSAPLLATGEVSYQWSAIGLPGWLTLNATTGVLSGTPPAVGAVFIFVQAANAAETNEVSQLQGLKLNIGDNPPPADFAITLSPDPLQLVKAVGCTGSSTVHIVPAYGFSNFVELSLSSSPGFAHLTQTAIQPGQTSTVVIPSNCGLPVKTSVTITGKSGGLTHTAILQVLPPVTLNCDVFVGEGPKPLLCR